MARPFSTQKKLEDLRKDIPAFKEYYYMRMLQEEASNPLKILADFNALHPELGFYPYTPQYRRWQALWNPEINAKRMSRNLIPITTNSLIKVRDDMGGLIAPPPNTEIEEASRTLAGELMNDAMDMLKDDQKRGAEIYDDDIIVKRRKYILSVFNFVNRAAQAGEALKLKQAANQRENTNFLMDLLRRSTAGKISEEEMSLLRSSAKIDEPSNVGQNFEPLPGINAA